MSRTIIPTLLALARSFAGRPTIALDIADRRLHWRELHAGSGAAQLCDQVANGTTIHRVLLAGTNAYAARVTDPTVAAQWTNWATTLTTAAATTDVAIASYAANCIRAFWDSTATGTYIREKQSTDDGVSWSTFTNVVAPSGTRHFAAAHQRLFYTTGGTLGTKSKATGSWGSETTWSACPAYTTCHGLAACYNDDNTYSLLLAHDGYLIWTTFDESTGWGAPVQLIPGWNGLPGADAAPQYPSILKLTSSWLVSYLDTYAASPAWTQPIVLETNGKDIRNATALHLEATTHMRTALTYLASTSTFYAANVNYVLAAHAYDPASTSQNLSDLAVRSYERHTSAFASTIRLEVWDAAGALKPFAQDGEAAQALRPLAVATVKRGYYVGSTATQVSLDPHYVTRIVYRWGLDRGFCHIEAVDGWGLLALWRPDTALTYTARPVIDLVNHLLGRVGLQAAGDGSAGTTYEVPSLTLTPATDGLTAVRSLLELAGLAGYWQANGTLYLFRLDTWSPAALTVGPDEIVSAKLGVAVPQANIVRVYGQDASLNQVGGAAADDEGAQTLGLNLLSTRFDKRLTTDAQASISALGEAKRAAHNERQDELTLPLRPDVEMWDTVSLTTDTTLVPTATKGRRVIGIAEEHDAQHGIYCTTLRLSAP